MTADALSTATLAIYAVLDIPVFFCLVRHGKAGLVGWVYLLAFCTLRIVGGAMAMDRNSSSNSSSSASLIANIGLSPLLLAASGILHEGRRYRAAAGDNKKTEWLLDLAFHAIVAPGVALLAAGASGLQRANTATSSKTDLVLVSVGIALLAAAWVGLWIWTAFSFLPSSVFLGRRQPRKNAMIDNAGAAATVHGDGTKLLWGVAAALPFIGVRVLCSLVALMTRRAYLNPSTGALSIRVVVVFLPELVACPVLIAAGVATRPAVSR
ncbi:hypothetical protein PG993_011466 [Apiospora rasikravindrae]|uniref:DUF7702 domain-containing protein n=1 Tax=Apiospora rasikravindrae TaxID=990691 RepID=A0ABR1SEC7_9PEZI